MSRKPILLRLCRTLFLKLDACILVGHLTHSKARKDQYLIAALNLIIANSLGQTNCQFSISQLVIVRT